MWLVLVIFFRDLALLGGSKKGVRSSVGKSLLQLFFSEQVEERRKSRRWQRARLGSPAESGHEKVCMCLVHVCVCLGPNNRRDVSACTLVGGYKRLHL